jgi:hypothetical protein
LHSKPGGRQIDISFFQNLEANDIIRIVAAVNPDSSSPDVEAFASILEIT